MYTVKISSFALDKIAYHTNKRYEQIGLLLGTYTNNEFVISDTAEGKGEADNKTSIFSPQSLAHIAQQIISGRLNGNIVGWYHSHIGGGVFMSEIDLQTQCNLQQFSPYIIALVIDTTTNQYGIFSYLDNLGLVQIPDNHISMF